LALTDMKLVVRSMNARRFSTSVTILTVAIAVGLLLTILSIRDSGRASFARGSGNMHLLISRDASPLVAVLNGVFYANAPRNYLMWSDYEELREKYPLEYSVPLQLGDSYRGAPIVATTSEYFSEFEPVVDQPWKVETGRFFKRPFEVVVGAEASEQFNLNLGDRIELTHGIGSQKESDDDHGHHHHHHDEYEYEVVGILSPTASAHDRAIYSDLTSSWIVHAHDRRQQSNHGHIELTKADDLIEDDRKITGVYARVLTRPNRSASSAIQQVFSGLRSDPTITVASPASQITRLFAIVGSVDQILIWMAFVVVIASAIAIMLALYNSIEQRRRQIAVLRVLGCSRSRIFSLVITESAIIGLIGSIIGIAIAVIGTSVVAGVVREQLGINIAIQTWSVWTLIVGTGTVCLAAAAGFFPAMTAYRTSVVKHLRPLG
jgi:putative ABC transport system permease protein